MAVEKENVANARSASPSPSPAPAKAASAGEDQLPPELEGMSLIFTGLVDKKTKVVDLVASWMETFDESADDGLAALVNFVLHCTGSTILLSTTQVLTEDLDPLLAAIVKEFTHPTYPLVNPDLKKKVKFGPRLEAFWAELINLAANSLLPAEDVFATLLRWITAMSSCTVRAFRHTATITAYAIMAPLMGVAQAGLRQLSLAERQMLTFAKQATAAGSDGDDDDDDDDDDDSPTPMDEESAVGKRRSSRGSRNMASRIDMLKNRIATLKINVARAESFLKSLFSTIFVHRYRDSVGLLRAKSIAALGEWIAGYPKIFLEPSYLKYLGWTLSDKDANVRLAALKALRGLYDDSNAITALSSFTERFRGRILEMAKDSSVNVAVEALGTLSALLETSMLEQSDIDAVYFYISVENRKIRTEAAHFVRKHLFDIIIASQLLPGQSDDEVDKARVRGFVQFVLNFSYQAQNPVYIVDALFKHAPCLTAWPVMLDLLQEEPASNVDPGTHAAEQDLLVRVLAACARLATGGSVIPNEPAHVSASAAAAAAAAIRTTFLPRMTDLFALFAGKPPQLALLLELVEVMDLSDVAADDSLRDAFDACLAAAHKLLFASAEPEVFAQVAGLYGTLLAAAPQLTTKVENALAQDLYAMVESVDNARAGGSMPDPASAAGRDNLRTLALALQRAAAFATAHDLSLHDAAPLVDAAAAFIDVAVAALAAAADPASVADCYSPAALDAALRILFGHAAWARARVEEPLVALAAKESAGETVPEESILGVKTEVAAVLEAYAGLVRAVESLLLPSAAVKLGPTDYLPTLCTAVGVAVDAALLFAPRLGETALAPLATPLSTPLQADMVSFMEQLFEAYENAYADESVPDDVLGAVYDATDATLGALVRGFAFGGLDTAYAAHLVTHYQEHDRLFAPVIGGMVKRMVTRLSAAVAEPLIEALKFKLADAEEHAKLLPKGQTRRLTASDSLRAPIRRLATKLAADTKDAILVVQQIFALGIPAALADAPTNFALLDGLASFSSRLNADQKAEVLKFLEANFKALEKNLIFAKEDIDMYNKLRAKLGASVPPPAKPASAKAKAKKSNKTKRSSRKASHGKITIASLTEDHTSVVPVLGAKRKSKRARKSSNLSSDLLVTPPSKARKNSARTSPSSTTAPLTLEALDAPSPTPPVGDPAGGVGLPPADDDIVDDHADEDFAAPRRRRARRSLL
ncbi:uncharacterized protein AMSG_04634 [Thecamonas trahens ATCC 50062]|uniref:SCD domain-containing protein n=1 Tax=Thecamonas trahens ATCC 50062 TaxID=461836 RepID=A0A0L0D9H3_THETB|nr:hypothetical protein AMSG_04634 [Thecamonas trahens ATCC 50062]KNC48890.1 hypothetical protein AMSG_04634 [Thecamonas trahens ATCC 50062]|eukprot:XP_013758308.1 hypothetical protein AMSG_04634 [Thecamonas trahens ATCC 50062]